MHLYTSLWLIQVIFANEKCQFFKTQAQTWIFKRHVLIENIFCSIFGLVPDIYLMFQIHHFFIV